jgi:hypothetical protein
MATDTRTTIEELMESQHTTIVELWEMVFSDIHAKVVISLG